MGARQRRIPQRDTSDALTIAPSADVIIAIPFSVPRWAVSMPMSRKSGFDIANIMMSPRRNRNMYDSTSGAWGWRMNDANEAANARAEAAPRALDATGSRGCSGGMIAWFRR